eukprot:9323424-Ditylum_brightwellii.AAC.1
MRGKPNAIICKEWDKDILNLINKWKEKDADIILMVGTNEGLDEKALGELILFAGMYNLMSTNHGLDTPNTHIKGSKALEYIFGAPNVLSATARIGMLKFHDGIPSDHCAIIADIHLKQLLHGEIQNTMKTPTKRLHPKFYRQNKSYRERAIKFFTKLNLKDRIKELEL